MGSKDKSIRASDLQNFISFLFSLFVMVLLTLGLGLGLGLGLCRLICFDAARKTRDSER